MSGDAEARQKVIAAKFNMRLKQTLWLRQILSFCPDPRR